MLLEKLSLAFGPSGYEQDVRRVLRQELADYVPKWQGDALGNLFAQKSGTEGPKVMLAAHMDECGLLIDHIDGTGLLQFQKVGGLDDRVLVSKPVLIGEQRLPGVIGAKAIHLQKPEERTQVIPFRSLYIDIGASTKEEAESMVKLGDYAVFATSFCQFGEGMVKGKSFDDRAGCTVLAEVLKEDYLTPVVGAFTVQEEIGLRGAGVAAYRVEPDLAIVLEGTTCSDTPGSEEHSYCTTIGGGPAISVMDASVITNKRMVAELVRLAEDNGIPYQFKRSISGGSDAGRINQTKSGIPVAVISVPCRYIHSPVSVLKLSDLEYTVQLVKLFLRSIEGGFRV